MKITNFGYAKYLSGNEGTGILKSHLGTETYMAPEIHEYKGYNGVKIDLFAAGVLLFTMKSKGPPFSKASLQDRFYNSFQNP